MNGAEIVQAAWGALVLVGIGLLVLETRRTGGAVRAWLRALGSPRPKTAMGFDPKRGVEVKTHAEDGDA